MVAPSDRLRLTRQLAAGNQQQQRAIKHRQHNGRDGEMIHYFISLASNMVITQTHSLPTQSQHPEQNGHRKTRSRWPSLPRPEARGQRCSAARTYHCRAMRCLSRPIGNRKRFTRTVSKTQADHGREGTRPRAADTTRKSSSRRRVRGSRGVPSVALLRCTFDGDLPRFAKNQTVCALRPVQVGPPDQL